MVPSGNKPLPRPILTLTYVAIWHHKVTNFTHNCSIISQSIFFNLLTKDVQYVHPPEWDCGMLQLNQICVAYSVIGLCYILVPVCIKHANVFKLDATRTTRMPAFWEYPHWPMIIHTIDSYQIPSQNKTKSKLPISKICPKFKFCNFAMNFTRDTPPEVA